VQWHVKMRSIETGLRLTNYGLRATGYGFWATDCWLWLMGYMANGADWVFRDCEYDDDATIAWISARGRSSKCRGQGSGRLLIEIDGDVKAAPHCKKSMKI